LYKGPDVLTDGPSRFLSYRPPNILPALTFLANFLSLLSSSPSAKHLFTTTLPSQTSFSITDIQLTTSPTLNFLQLALITIQRAPGEGVSGVAARGLDGGVAKEWEALVGRYRRISGVNGVLGQKEVQEVSERGLESSGTLRWYLYSVLGCSGTRVLGYLGTRALAQKLVRLK
jgi:hypothetical protein